MEENFLGLVSYQKQMYKLILVMLFLGSAMPAFETFVTIVWYGSPVKLEYIL
jgi:hypothetical protein